MIEKIKAIDSSLPGEEQTKQLAVLTQEWNAIGFVPFKEKDNVYKEYKQATNALYEALHVNANERKLANFRNNIAKGGGSLQREREHLIRQYEAMKNEIATYENNIGFFAMSKNAEPLIKQMQERIDAAKAELNALAQQIKALNESENN